MIDKSCYYSNECVLDSILKFIATIMHVYHLIYLMSMVLDTRYIEFKLSLLGTRLSYAIMRVINYKISANISITVIETIKNAIYRFKLVYISVKLLIVTSNFS